jgi:flagellar biosynthesis/type III secretory pathway protein FliH
MDNWKEKLYDLELATDDTDDWEKIENFIDKVLSDQAKQLQERHNKELKEAIDVAYEKGYHTGTFTYRNKIVIKELYKKYNL